MPKVSFRMASASRESVFDVQTSRAPKNHRSGHTEGQLTTTPSGCCVRKGPSTGRFNGTTTTTVQRADWARLAPPRLHERGAGGGVVEATNELSRAHQPPVGEADRRAVDRLAVDVGEHLASVLVGAQQARGAIEARGLEVAQDGVHEVRAGVSRSANGVADARDADGLAPTVERLLAPLIHDARSVPRGAGRRGRRWRRRRAP